MDKAKQKVIAANYCITQSEGFYQGYDTAVYEIVDALAKYADVFDDRLEIAVMRSLMEMAKNSVKRKLKYEENVRNAKRIGYAEESFIPDGAMPFVQPVKVYTKESEAEAYEKDLSVKVR